MTVAFQKAVSELYVAFDHEPRPAVVEGCPCCITKEESCALVSKPLRALTPKDLSDYASSVFLTVGSKADFHYFLTRILEILVTENGWWPSPEIVGRAIATAGWAGFSATQQNAVAAFFDAVLLALIEHADKWGIDTWICAFAKFGPDLNRYLKIIETHPPALLAFYERNSQPLGREKLGNAFWADDSPGALLVLNWFQSERLKNAINTAYGIT